MGPLPMTANFFIITHLIPVIKHQCTQHDCHNTDYLSMAKWIHDHISPNTPVTSTVHGERAEVLSTQEKGAHLDKCFIMFLFLRLA